MREDFEHAADLQQLADADRPSPDDVSALRHRLRRSLHQASRRRGLRAALAAATVLLVVGGSLGSRFATRDSPGAPKKVELSGDTPVAVTAGVHVMAQGDGDARVVPGGVELDWRSGSVSLDVAPQAERTVVVRTDEAEVTVLGTVFAVERGPFGTQTQVTRGRVQVSCRGQGALVVAANDSAWCFRDAGAGLGRALLEARQGVGAEDRLRVVDQALAHPDGLPETRALLLGLRVQALVDVGRDDAAIATARRLPPAARVQELSARADAAMSEGECGAAEPWLVALGEEGDATGILLLVQCLAEDHPDKARRALDRLTGRKLDWRSREAVRAWRQRLGER